MNLNNKAGDITARNLWEVAASLSGMPGHMLFNLIVLISVDVMWVVAVCLHASEIDVSVATTSVDAL